MVQFERCAEDGARTATPAAADTAQHSTASAAGVVDIRSPACETRVEGKFEPYAGEWEQRQWERGSEQWWGRREKRGEP